MVDIYFIEIPNGLNGKFSVGRSNEATNSKTAQVHFSILYE